MPYLKKHRPIIHPPLVLLFCIILMIAAGCTGGYASIGRTFQGTTLALTIVNIFSISELAYTEANGLPTLVEPSSIDNELTIVHIRLQNDIAEQVLLDMDAHPAELRTLNDERFLAINPSREGIPTNQPRLELTRQTLNDNHVPYPPDGLFIKGTTVLNKGFALEGWLVFDIPKDSELSELRWESAGDIMFIDL